MVNHDLDELEVEEVSVLALRKRLNELEALLVLLEEQRHVHSLKPRRQLGAALLEQLFSKLRLACHCRRLHNAVISLHCSALAQLFILHLELT